MNNFNFIVGIFLLSTSVFADESQLRGGEAALVEKLHAAYQGIRYYKADFEQIKNIKFLSQPIVSKGLLIFSSELGLVWEVHDPLWVKTIINDEGVFKSNHRETKKKVKDPQIKVVASILTELLSSQLDRVESQFDIQNTVYNEANDEWSVMLIAKGVLIKKAISQIQINGKLNSDDSSNGIQSIVISDASGDETLINLSEQLLSKTEVTSEQRKAFD